MTTETTTLSYTTDRLADAARIWAAACATNGAMAPDHVADVLSDLWDARHITPLVEQWDGARRPPYLVEALLEGTRRATEEHESYATLRRDGSLDHTGPEPRGCDVRTRGGRADELVWDTGGSHVIALRPVGGGPARAWYVAITVDATMLATSPRVAAMLGAAWAYRDSDAEQAAILDLAARLDGRQPDNEWQGEAMGLAAGIDAVHRRRLEAWLDAEADAQSARIAHRDETPTVAAGDVVTMTVDYDDGAFAIGEGDGIHVYRGTVRRLAPGGRRVLVDWEGEDRPRRSWYVDAAELRTT